MKKSKIDKKIDSLRRELQEAEAQKEQEVDRLKGLEHADAHLQAFYAQHELSESDLYLHKAAAITKWLKSLEADDDRPDFFAELQSFFVRLASGKKTRVAAAAKTAGPRLEIGFYVNPFTGEEVKKVKRNPRQLDQWLDEHGIEIVRTWKK